MLGKVMNGGGGGGIHDPYTPSTCDHMGILILGYGFLYITSDTL
jgi:hypothetical protein